MIAIVSDQFQVGEEVCGAVISIRFTEDIISIWNRNANDRDSKLKIQYVAAWTRGERGRSFEG